MFGWIRKRETQKVVAKAAAGILRLVVGGFGLEAALEEDELEQLAGLVAATAMGAWSVWDKISAAREKKRAAEAAAMKTAAILTDRVGGV